MEKDYPSEQWKTIKFDFDFSNDCRFEVSNFGRIRSFNKISKGAILKGSLVNGYRHHQDKIFRAEGETLQLRNDKLRERISYIQNN